MSTQQAQKNSLKDKTVDEKRKSELALVHILQKQLALDTDAACALKLSVTGKTSAKDMTPAERKRYVAALNKAVVAMGGPLRIKAVKRPALFRSPVDPQDFRYSKAQALWGQLHQLGVVGHNTDKALNAYIKRQTHIDAWRFLSPYQMNNVIESLKKWVGRVEKASLK